MLSNKSNRELVEAGHQFAKALDAEMPPTEIAKLVSALATRLDCAIVRGDELQKQFSSSCVMRDISEAPRDGRRFLMLTYTLATRDIQNRYVTLRTGTRWIEAYSCRDSWKEWCGNEKTTSTSVLDPIGWIPLPEPEGMTLYPVHVDRDKYGYWSHPDYLAFCDGREYIPSAEFNQWMEAKGLEWKVDYRDEEEIEPNVDGYDLCTWNPEAPSGDGWFVGSIHDTDDGAVCIWLRAKAVA